MPYSVNGIGTHYYGRGNRSEVVGRCEHCGRTARLTSYDTWECVCVFFIPLVPLRHFRILNDCSSCRRHQRLPLKDFRRLFDEKVVPLREKVARAPHDAETRRALVEALMGLKMWTEADREARDGVSAIPADAELNRLAGEVAAYRGDRAGATPYLRRAVELSPKDVPLRTQLGQHLLEVGDREGAIRELSQAQATDRSHWQAAYWLGQALLKESRWSEALAALERVLALRADLASDRALLADIVRCKKALSYPLSPEEAKLARRRWWWPLGRGRASGQPAPGTPGWIVLPILGAVAVAALGVALWRQHHIPVYFDNGLSMPVKIVIGGRSLDVPSQGMVRRTLPPGRSEVVVSDKQGLIESAPVDVAPLGLFGALISSRFYVYNVSARHIYRRWTITYLNGPSPAPPRGPQSQLIAFQRFFVADHVDYAFETPPESISLSSGTRSATRTALAVAREIDHSALAVIRFGEGNLDEAERAARKAVEIDGCALRARRNLVLLLSAAERSEDALAEVERWRSACPAAGVEIERVHQDAMRAAGRRDQLLAVYRERLARSPNDAATHYLLGRLLDDPRASLAEQRQAVRLDPALTWAHVAMGYDLMALERPAEAAAALAAALALPHESIVVLPYAHAAVASGRLDEARQRLEEMSRAASRDATLIEARWLIAVAQRAWPTTVSLDRQLTTQTGDAGSALERQATAAALQGRAAEIDRALVAAGASPDTALTAAGLRFARQVEAEQPKEAVLGLEAAYARAKSEVPYVLQLHAASALLLAGEKAQAEERLQRLEAALAQAPDEPGVALVRTASGVLRGAQPVARLIGAAQRGEYLSLDDAYYWAGVRTQVDGRRDAARQLFRSSVRMSCDLRFPYLAARRLAGLGEDTARAE